jgi:hypothetical protein
MKETLYNKDDHHPSYRIYIYIYIQIKKPDANSLHNQENLKRIKMNVELYCELRFDHQSNSSVLII